MREPHMHRPRGSIALLALAAAIALTAGFTRDVSATRMAPIRGTPSDRLIVEYASDAALRADTGSVTGLGTPAETVSPLHLRVVKAAKGRGAAVAAQVASEPGVASVEYDQVIHATLVPDDPDWQSGQSWEHQQVSLPQAWDVTQGAATSTIAILDTGIDDQQTDFQGRILQGYDFVGNDPAAADDFGHGTMSAGVAAAAGNNTSEVAGACWSCLILPVKVLNSSGSGYASTAIAGITWAADHGARVISMSFGGFDYSTAFQNAINYARNKGAVVIGSAGNNGSTKVFYPGGFSGVISVAATTKSESLYSWSNRGSWVDVGAPGCLYTTKMGGGDTNFCGTSASTPLVAGIAGLLRSLRPNASGIQVESALLSSVDHTGINVKYGRVDAAAAVAAIQSMVAPPTAQITYSPPATITPACPSIQLRTGPSQINNLVQTLDPGHTATTSGTVLGNSYGSTCNHVGTYLWWYRITAIDGVPLDAPVYAGTAFWNAGNVTPTPPPPPQGQPAPYPATITAMCPSIRARTAPNASAPIVTKIDVRHTALATAQVLGSKYVSSCYHVGNYLWWYRITAIDGVPLSTPLYVATAFWRKP